MTKARPAGLLVLVAALFTLAFGASSARAEFGLERWEAVTCAENSDTPVLPGLENILAGLPPLEKDAEQCTGETESKWFTQATGHPNYGITDFTLNTYSGEGTKGFPEGFVKDIIVDTPEGLGVNPEATPTICTQEQMEATPLPTCPVSSLVGFNYLTIALEGPPCLHESPTPNWCFNGRVKLPVYNVEPFDGVPSMVAFPTSNPGHPTYIVGDLDPSDQHVRFTISDIESPLEGGPPVIGSRLVFMGKSGNGTYLTMPSNCAGGQTSVIHVDSWEGAEDSASFTTAVGADECDSAPFEPGLDTTASGRTDSPEPATVNVQMPKQLEAESRGQSHLLTTKVTLPDGTALNPAVANGLVACTDAQFKKGSDEPIECPAASRVGSVEVDTNALDQPLGGDVYVAKPLNNNPSSGEEFRIFIHAFNNRYGVNVRLVGKVYPNLKTGQLTAVVGDNPQAPFNSFRVTINGGPHGALSSPFTCGPHTTQAAYDSWSRPNEYVDASSNNTFDQAAYGGPCPQKLGDRRFKPIYLAGTRDSKAGAYSPFDLHVSRQDGEQELKKIDVTLPPGMAAKLKGVEYCPDANIVAAIGRSGSEELAAPSCPAASYVGAVSTLAGKAYMAGPYKGAPLSLVVVTPGVAGPYDLGNVVIRTPLYVNPETAVVHAVSDEIPDVFGGVRLDIRSIDISLNRQNYTFNPTNCGEPFGIAAQMYGGAEDPSNPAAWFAVGANAPFQATSCKALKFKPKFYAKILGGHNQTKRRAHPKFRAILQEQKGNANLARAAFILPKSTILDQGHIGTVCTRPNQEANTCPSKSVYGHAEATSPILDGKLKGRVFLVPSSHKLPDLLVDLHGQVPIKLRGVISSVNGRLKTVFPSAPDAPVTKFILTMKGGSRGLLQNTTSLCGKKQFGRLNLTAQNSRRYKTKHQRINVPGCNKHKGKKK